MIEKFLERVEPEPNSGCWLWVGHVNDNGYGLFHVNGRNVRAHRFAYEHYRGPIPEGLDLDHLCRVRCCVNPDHLEAVTRQVNLLRGIGFAAARAAQTHCIHGHKFTTENTGYDKGRYCRRCKRDQMRARRDAAGIKKSSPRRRGEVD